MFIIKSYIKYPNRLIKNFETVKKNPFYYFIDINDSEKILGIKNELDLDYLEGVICLSYNNQIITDFTYYDLIDQLWAYFLNMIEEFLKNKKSAMYFPDQPMPFSMTDISKNHILFSINFVEWTLPKYEFLSALLIGAEDFFEKMLPLSKQKSYNEPHKLDTPKLKNDRVLMNT